MMWRTICILVLYISYSKSQLNYEGNPLTENTEYTAEESHYTRHDGKRSQNFDEKSQFIDFYSVAANNFEKTDSEKFISPGMTLPSVVGISDKSIDMISVEHQPQDMAIGNINNFNSIKNNIGHDKTSYYTTNKIIVENDTQSSATQLTSPGTAALNDFLNSKTPEESQWALDNFLKNQQKNNQIQSQTTQSDYYSQNLQTIQDYQQSQQDNQQIYNKYNYDNINNINNNINDNNNDHHHVVNSLENYSNIQQTTSIIPTRDILNSPIYHSQRLTHWPYQNKNDYIPVSRRHSPQQYRQMPPRLIPRYRAQPRIGPNFIHKPPHLSGPTSFHHNKKPVEIIYTKPPGYSNGPPPVSYNDANKYFPHTDHDHKPYTNDIHYSQLWAQSYDPYYYDYIAKTGKIKPWLYGKLGKHNDEGSGFWSELFFNFKKHGMKNMMNPMFLMGLSIPMLTLMLSALIQKRSFARSNTNYHLSEDKINEMVEKVSQAIECYKQNNTKCWK